MFHPLFSCNSSPAKYCILPSNAWSPVSKTSFIQVWEEHFLFLTAASESREPTPLIINTGGPYEGHLRDRVWQDFALKAAVRHGLSIFYDGLNPHSGIGGDSPTDLAALGKRLDFHGVLRNSTGGLLKDDWSTPYASKLHALARAPHPAFCQTTI